MRRLGSNVGKRSIVRCYSSTPSSQTREVRNYINGQFENSKTTKWFDLKTPATGKVIGRVPESTQEEMRRAVEAAQTAYKQWSHVPVTVRARTMYEYRDRIMKNMDRLTSNITEELGKVKADAVGDVVRGLEIVEHATAAASHLMGDVQHQISNGLDVHSINAPMGVFAGVCPFNFPAMIPLWMFPLAIACGNTFVIKPSEKDPGAVEILAELSKGLWPDGVLNVIHGGKTAVDFLCDAPEIKGISFVGGGKVGNYIHARGSANGKRVQSNMAAKNHGVVLPDAQKERALDALVGAAFGASGQRCMALPVVLFVGEAQKWIPDYVAKAKALKFGPGTQADAAYGPLISLESKQRAERIIAESAARGAKILLDGRGAVVKGYETGNYLGPTVIDGTDGGLDNPCYTEEIFGPVATILRVNSLDEAIALVNKNPYGNGTAIFTSSGAAARKYQMEIEAGQIGINLPIPVPPFFFSFTGSKASFLGSQNFFGKGGYKFYTQTKTVMSNWWADDVSEGVSTVMPLHGR